jgi:hypothetical protein
MLNANIREPVRLWRIQVSALTYYGSSGAFMRSANSPQLAPARSTDAELVGRANAREEAAIRSIMQSNNRFGKPLLTG